MMAPRAHSSMAEQPAHNRLDLGSSPGGPTVVAGAATPPYSVGGLRQGAVWLRPARRFSLHRAATPPYSVGGLRQGAVWLRPARRFSLHRAATPPYSVGGLRQGAVWLRPARRSSRRVAPVLRQSEGVWIHSFLR